MAEFPALPLFTDAYLSDTRHLTTEEHGAYLLLLMEAWRRPDCSLPDDDKLLARLAGMPVARWQEVKPVVMEFWKRDGRRKIWTQKRLLKERVYVAEKSASQRDKIVKRWSKTKNEDTAVLPNAYRNDTPTPTPTPTPSSLRSEDGGGGSAGAREVENSGQDLTDRERLLVAMRVNPVSGLTGHGGSRIGTQADMAEVARWMSLPGMSIDAVHGEVERIMAGKTDGPPSSFRYFTPAMQRLSAALSAPPLQPTARASPEFSPPPEPVRKVRARLPSEIPQ